ncbi:FUSC family protein [soil metagenome]
MTYFPNILRHRASGPWRLLAIFDRSPSDLGVNEALYSLKSFAAAMIAYYIALSIGLNRPYWAIITCYIVSNPLAGAVVSKAVFRMIGTAIGAIVAILFVPNLVNRPEILSLALALWLGLCTYLSLLDRTPRAYIALLAGYTAGIIGFSAVSAPDTIFTIASLRVQEIMIGIVTATVVHGLLLPQSVTVQLRGRIRSIMADAERWSADALDGDGHLADLDRDRRRLAIDLNELHQLSLHVPYDTSGRALRIDLLRALQDRLAMLLPLASAIDDRVTQLRVLGSQNDEIIALIEDVRAWLCPNGETNPNIRNSEDMIRQARNLEPMLAGVVSWPDALRLSLLDRLADLLEAHAVCREIQRLLYDGGRVRSREVRAQLASSEKRPLHRDHGIALRGALGTTLTVIVGCAFWITTAWPEGASAVVIASIVCALFSNLNDPVPVAKRVFFGTMFAVVAAAGYSFIILPRVADFVLLVAVLAPFFLVIGFLQSQQRYAAFAIGVVLSFPGIVGLNEHYDSSFATFANAAAAQLAGVMLAVITLGMVRTIGAESAAYRLIRAGWRDLANRALGKGEPDTAAWISQMLDRVGLLTPQLLSIGLDPSMPLRDVLRDTRVGISVDELRRFRTRARERDVKLSTIVLRGVHDHFRSHTISGKADADAKLLRRLDLALSQLGRTANRDDRRLAILALTSLRRNLAPSAETPEAKVAEL